MLKIEDSLGKIVLLNQFFRRGLERRFFNLSKLAQYLQPYLEADLKKSVKPGAILMNLSRLQAKLQEGVSEQDQVSGDKTVQGIQDAFKIHYAHGEEFFSKSNLYLVTFEKKKKTRQQVYSFYSSVRQARQFIRLVESDRHITLIVGHPFLETMPEAVVQKPVLQITNLMLLGLRFDPKDIRNSTKLRSQILDRFSFADVLVVEQFSEFDELFFLVRKEDSTKAYELMEVFI